MSTESRIEARDAKAAGGVVAEGRETLQAQQQMEMAKAQQAAYAAEHADRRGWTDETDVQIASRVRMLMRDDLDHEAVVCAARDRICALVTELTAAQAREAGRDDYWNSHMALSEIVSLQGEYDALNGGGPGWRERWKKALADAEELVRVEP